MTDAEALRLLIDRIRGGADPFRAMAGCYSALRRGSPERDWPAWMAVEAAWRIGLWLR